MIVRDLTHQQARAAADWSTAETHAHLRSEVELAQRQLWTLQELTDPTLNLLGAVQFVSELLDRLRSAIHAEGVALVHFGRHRRHLLCASEGLQCQRVHQRSGAAVTTDRARAVMIHNDPTAAAEVSAAVWPDDVSSLIAVPLVRAGSTTAVLEVVNRTGRRATEWEIALVQVVAARMAGFLEDESSMNAAAERGPLRVHPRARASSQDPICDSRSTNASPTWRVRPSPRPARAATRGWTKERGGANRAISGGSDVGPERRQLRSLRIRSGRSRSMARSGATAPRHAGRPPRGEWRHDRASRPGSASAPSAAALDRPAL